MIYQRISRIGCIDCVRRRGIGDALDLPVYVPAGTQFELTPAIPAPSPWAGIVQANVNARPLPVQPRPLPAVVSPPVIKPAKSVFDNINTLVQSLFPKPAGQAPPPPSGAQQSWMDQQFIAGVSNKTLLLGGLAVVALASARKR